MTVRNRLIPRDVLLAPVPAGPRFVRFLRPQGHGAGNKLGAGEVVGQQGGGAKLPELEPQVFRRQPQPDNGSSVAIASKARINRRVNMITLRLRAGDAEVPRRRHRDQPPGANRAPGAITPTERTTLGLACAAAIRNLSETDPKLRLLERL